MVDEDGSVKFLVTDSLTSDVLVLTNNEKAEMQQYLKLHYLTDHVEPPQSVDVQNPNTSIQESELKSKISVHHPLFFNRSIKKHVLGYAAIGIVVLQFFLIPANVYSIKFNDFTKVAWVSTFSILTYVAVLNFKRHFLIGGIRYGTVWSITFWLYTYVFIVGGIELAIIDSIKGMSAAYILIPIILLAAYLSGWILSFPIYFLSGGKIVTDPKAIKFRD